MKCSVCTLAIKKGELHSRLPEPAHDECLMQTRCESCKWKDRQAGICLRCVDYDWYDPKDHETTGDSANEQVQTRMENRCSRRLSGVVS